MRSPGATRAVACGEGEREQKACVKKLLWEVFILLLIIMHTFLITITQPGGMSEKQCESCETWVRGLDVKSVCSRESHKSGLLHVHAVIEDPNGRANGLRRKIVRALGEIMDFTPHNALDVKLVTVGTESKAAGYAVKDGITMVVNGWSIKSLLAERAALLQQDVGKKPKATYMLNEKNVEEIILEYASRTNLPLTCKHEFIDCVSAMQQEGYSFARVKPMLVYAQVMARAGSPEYARDWWEMKLGTQM